MIDFELTLLNLAFTLLWILAPPIITRFVDTKFALLGSGIALITLWLLGWMYPVGLGVCVGVMLTLWVDYRKRRHCPGCNKPVERADSLCDECQQKFGDDLTGGAPR